MATGLYAIIEQIEEHEVWIHYKLVKCLVDSVMAEHFQLSVLTIYFGKKY
jgi:hypothetical protein